MVLTLKEFVFHRNNVEATSKLLNGHRDHEAVEKHRDIGVFEVPGVYAFIFDSVINIET